MTICRFQGSVPDVLKGLLPVWFGLRVTGVDAGLVVGVWLH